MLVGRRPDEVLADGGRARRRRCRAAPGRASAWPARPASASPHTRWARSGMNMIGSQPSATSAVASTLLPISDAHQIGMLDRTGWLMSLSGLPSPVPSPSGSGIWTVSPSYVEPLAPPHHAADVDVLLDARHRLLVGHAVEALDDLRAGGAEAADDAAVAHVVEPGERHRHQRRRAGVDVDDARADLDALGLGRQVAHLADGVEAVGLGHPHDVEARPARGRRPAGPRP